MKPHIFPKKKVAEGGDSTILRDRDDGTMQPFGPAVLDEDEMRGTDLLPF